MPIIEPVIRPPSESQSFLLQVTTGCSANTCDFCAAYLEKSFKAKVFLEIKNDIKAGSREFPDCRRVFLMDGDALALNNRRLLPILDELNKSFPKLTRISSYANGYNITWRKKEELDELKSRKLSLIYMGLESGSQKILDYHNKRSKAKEMVDAVRMCQDAG